MYNGTLSDCRRHHVSPPILLADLRAIRSVAVSYVIFISFNDFCLTNNLKIYQTDLCEILRWH